MSKQKVLIIFGGKSGEHQVSIMSATSIAKYMDKEKFEPLFIGIDNDGKWIAGDSIEELTIGGKVKSNKNLTLPDARNELTLSDKKETKQTDQLVVFPIVHGTHGEDGTLQGFLELSNLPYVGSGVLGSALAMDKVAQKMVTATAGIPQTKFLAISRYEWDNNIFDSQKITQKLTLPIFVKPANLGSSVGISKVKAKTDLVQAINQAFEFDNKVIVEEAIEDILEIEVSVLGNQNPKASVCGGIQPNSEFYDYDTKYVTDDIVNTIPADIPEEISLKIRKTAVETFKVLNCSGLARVDFFYQKKTGNFYLNEINTLPGFTKISMYPKLWEATGLSYTDLITELIELAKEKWQTKQKIKYDYK